MALPILHSEDGNPPSSKPKDPRVHLLGLRRQQLGEVLAEVIDRPFRVEQIYRALYERQITDFEQMTDLGKGLRQQLSDRFRIDRPATTRVHLSADGTAKHLFELDDGATIEAVDIPEGDRRTLCLSSQAGCALACRFCVTGFWGSGRDLTAGEILSQVLALGGLGGEAGVNLVFMGMGEPLLNLEHLGSALEILMEQISWRRITVSTAGVIPGIEAMAKWEKRPQLAISLHAPDEERRNQLMPINRKYPLRELLPALARYPLVAKQRITFEYILIEGFNDSPGDAELLAKKLRGLRAKVNLIPLNPDPVLDNWMKRPADARSTAFRDRLRQHGLLATVRKQRGDDVSAACGQLRAADRDPRGFRRSNLSL